MSRRILNGPSGEQVYRQQLRDAMSVFLPQRGLPLLSDDRRVRWTTRMLAMGMILMVWSGAATLLDRFSQARMAVAQMYPTRRRPGQSVEGFYKALDRDGQSLLETLCRYWRTCVQRVAGQHWTINGWLLFGVDGSKFDCPRTAANEQGFGVSGKGKSGPQQLLTCLFHLGSGVLWGWTRDGVQGRGEPTQLRQLLDLLPPQAMLLADAGFTGYDLLKEIMHRGNHFLIRVGSNVKLIKNLGYVQHEGKQTVYLWPLNKQGRSAKNQNKKTLLKVHPPLTLRLIELRDAKGRPVFLLTSVLSAKLLSDRAAAKMYRLRWGLELMWRGLKQTMGHHKMLGRTPARAGAELDWAMAGLWMLQLLAASRLSQTRQSPAQSSPAKALRIVRRALNGRSGRGVSLAKQLTEASKDAYHRCGGKQSRYRRQTRPQRPPGSPEARMATTIEKRLIQQILEQKPPDSFAA
jgi:hypothetical protein